MNTEADLDEALGLIQDLKRFDALYNPEIRQPIPRDEWGRQTIPYLLERAVEKVRAGEFRNDVGFWLACQLRDNRYSKEEADPVMLAFAETVRVSGDHEYKDAEALATCRSAYRTAPREPPSAPGGSQAGRNGRASAESPHADPASSASSNSSNSSNGQGHRAGSATGAGARTDWEEPIPLSSEHTPPPFPTELLPGALARWVEAEAEATQTPPDLAAGLGLAIAGAGLAGKVRVTVRRGWTEPTNLYTVVALPPGDRKSAVFADAIAPVQEVERREQERMAPAIAEAASAHRVLEQRLKHLEGAAAKTKSSSDTAGLREEVKQVARELAAHQVPELPQLYCDDETPENLAKLLALHGGRMLQASAEGTAFEIVKGRYSETPNFDVYLKGHAGDPMRVGRVSRGSDTVDNPALSAALAVQPDVIRGLADHASMRGRGFLARWLYSMPVSRVGRRSVAAAPVPAAITGSYRGTIAKLWELPGSRDQDGKPTPHWLMFSPEADQAIQELESWLEPQLAWGEELSHLAGWAQKLAGAVARIAGILHVADAVSQDGDWRQPISQHTVERAIRLGRDYFLLHALAAFGMMGADPRAELGNLILAGISQQLEDVEDVEHAPPVSRRDIHQRHRRRCRTVEDLDPILDLLVKHGWLRPTGAGQPGRGHQGPTYRVNPAIKRFRS
jgi:hypothetical protein